MKSTKRIVAFLAVCMLILPGCTPEVNNTWPDKFETTTTDALVETTTTDAPVETTSNWEQILTYSEYLAMSKEEQDDFYASFETPQEFFQWFDAVKAIYDEERKENDFDGSGVIDIGGASGNGQQ